MTPAEHVADLVRQLLDGWEERIEYQVMIQMHAPLCQIGRAAMTPGRRKHYVCVCPQRLEERARSALQPPLVDQLQEAISEPVANGSGSGSGARDKPHSNPPGNGEALELLMKIQATAWLHHGKLRAELYPDHVHAPRITAPAVLRQIADWSAMASDGTLECGYSLVVDVKEDLRKLVKTARIILEYDSPQRMLEETVCGNCSGALIVAEDASSDVRCIGAPDAPGCGQRYFRWDWINLLEGEGA
ncbi:hypothetical protein [Streptomyces sp. NPDC046925]|uniref:DUF7341 domain-containing protein n=1 Tax=Streptomyces sp. NPDC046925 TaxID=3155375 RepID=UPI0033C2C6D5